LAVNLYKKLAGREPTNAAPILTKMPNDLVGLTLHANMVRHALSLKIK
jgi:hypothetical protein